MKRYPTVFIVVFCAGCIVLATLTRLIENHEVAIKMIAVVVWLFIIGLFALEVRAGWLRQHEKPRRPWTICMFLGFAVAATAAAAYLHPLVPFRSWFRLLVALLGIWGVFTIAGTLGALTQHVRKLSVNNRFERDA